MPRPGPSPPPPPPAGQAPTAHPPARLSALLPTSSKTGVRYSRWLGCSENVLSFVMNLEIKNIILIDLKKKGSTYFGRAHSAT